jgi:hypothetical protein
MHVEITKVVAGERLEQAWKLYELAFDELRAKAVQRHLMHRAEFDDVMADDRVQKYVAYDDDDRLVGLATYTNDLDAMPLISPEYFADRWPNYYAQRRIWYLGFFAVHPQHRGSGMFELVIERLWDSVRADRGVAALDICARNHAIGLPIAIQRTLEGLTPDVVTTAIDQQTFWAYELPAG